MDLQIVVALNFVAISAVTIAQLLLLEPRGPTSWLAVNAAVVLVGCLATFLAPAHSGTLTALIFVPFIALPYLLGHLAQRASLAGKHAAAARLAKATALLHPSRDLRRNAAVMDALDHRGTGRADAMLAELARATEPERRLPIEAQAASERGDWAEVARLVKSATTDRRALAAFEVRALGELGHLDAMIERQSEASAAMDLRTRTTAALFTLAFAGKSDAVGRLLEGRASALDPDTKVYWRAVSLVAAGDPLGQGKAALEHLSRDAEVPRVRAAAHRSLTRPLADLARHISVANRKTVEALAERIAPTAPTPRPQPGPAPSSPGRFAYPVTIVLIAINLAMYGLELYSGDPESFRVLLPLGALVPEDVVNGQWWRLVTAAMLHAGTLHLVFNMLTLGVLGSALESMAGSVWMAIVYIVGGIGSNAIVFWLTISKLIDDNVLVGASGAIFAVFGALATHAAMAWWTTRHRLHLARLVNVGVILLIQVLVTYALPGISVPAHAAGFAIGLVLGIPLAAGLLRSDTLRTA